AAIVDPDLLNAWGMSKRPTSPVWVSNNHSDTSTLYKGGTAAMPSDVAKQGLTVTMAGDPTGQVANLSTGFALNGSPALFIFATEQGQIFAWNQSVGTTAMQMGTVANGNFKGLAEGMVGSDSFLYSADFANGQIEVWDSNWNMVDWPGAFHVRHLPAGFAPFNAQVLTDATGTQHVFVAYAKRNPATGDEIAGRGLGLVAEFNTDGTFVRRFRSDSLNAPWGLAYAPASWGRAAGDLLVGQFGSGRIEMFDPWSGSDDGTVRDAQGHKLVIDGLWALMAGDTTSGGADTILFTAGPNDETDGLYGVLTRTHRSHHEDN
ncbi:MAG: TIGR03118 family protein, partial [Ilumatobacteraceae bacterium]